MKQPRIIAVHLLNDFSGSPFVFSQAVETLQLHGHEVHLFTATPSGNGFLSNKENLNYHPLYYRWSSKKWLTLFLFLYSQLYLFARLLFFIRRSDIVYINSMLPFGAALAAWIRRSPVVYHLHEISIQPALLKKWLLVVINLTATKCLFVSRYLMDNLGLQKPATVICNSLPECFTEKAGATVDPYTDPFTVLMLCSLKAYKGINEMVNIARHLPDMHFKIVFNASQQNIAQYFSETSLPENLTLYPTHADVHFFYQKAAVVVNLSLTDQWIETFGMTILEAMHYGKPVIVPPVGGVTELVEEGVNGFHVNSRNTIAVSERLRQLAVDNGLYKSMSDAAVKRARLFNADCFRRALIGQMQLITRQNTPVKINQNTIPKN